MCLPPNSELLERSSFVKLFMVDVNNSCSVLESTCSRVVVAMVGECGELNSGVGGDVSESRSIPLSFSLTTELRDDRISSQ